MRRLFLGMAGIGALLLGFSVFIYSGTRAPESEAKNERFIVKITDSEEEVILALKNKGFIKNPLIFKYLLNLKKGSKKISAGAYYLSKKANAAGLAGALILGPSEKWVTLPPGKRKEQAALIFQKALGWPDGLVRSFIVTAQEGYLFPDTYLIPTDADAREIVVRLKNNFDEKAGQVNTTVVTIASLLERESGSEEDKPVIAGVIWNRLNKGMKLEIDATVQYALATREIGQFLKDFRSDLTGGGRIIADDFYFWPLVQARDLRRTFSAYNTYLNQGLPPGPICSPGLSSLKAAAFPAKTEALYYLHSPDKQIHTARTYQEHLENIEKYLK